MKRLIWLGAVMTLAGGICWAAAGEPPTPGFAKKGPCKEILSACQQAGYYYGGVKKGPNKGEYVNCMKPILEGQSVSGVNVTPQQVSACQAVKEHKHGQKVAAGGAASGQPATSAPAATPTPPAAQ